MGLKCIPLPFLTKANATATAGGSHRQCIWVLIGSVSRIGWDQRLCWAHLARGYAWPFCFRVRFSVAWVADIGIFLLDPHVCGSGGCGAFVLYPWGGLSVAAPGWRWPTLLWRPGVVIDSASGSCFGGSHGMDGPGVSAGPIWHMGLSALMPLCLLLACVAFCLSGWALQSGRALSQWWQMPLQ